MKRQSILLTVLGIVIVGAGIWWFTNYPISFRPQSAGDQATVNENVNAGPTLPTTISYTGEDGATVLELLKRNHEVIESSGFVEGIDGRVGSSNNYWLWYVNGQEGPVGAAEYKTKAGETIEWRFVETK